MRWVAAIVMCLALSACGLFSSSPSDSTLSTVEFRRLADPEKAALARSLSQSLSAPETAQFKWMPVILASRGGSTPYCGLIDVRGAGFHKFFARIQGSSGQYDRGVIDRVEGAPGAPAGAGGAGKAASEGSAEEMCKAAGYVDFNLAN